MASKDFRASQVLTSRLIMSGVAGAGNLGLVVYSGSISTDQIGNVSDGNLFSNVGNDVTIFFSGSDGSKYGNTGGAVLFGGDVVVSGTLYAERQVIEVDESVTGSLLVSGSMIVSQSATIKEGLSVNTSLEEGSENSFIVYNATGGKSIFSDSTSKQVFILSGTNSSPISANESSYTDVNFFVSGAIGSKDTVSKGTGLFGGDLHVSGNLTVGGSSSGTGNTLDQAYDQGGAGAGAVITVDQQPVQLVASSGGQALAVTGSAIFGDRSSQFSNHLPPMPGPDTMFFFSGTIGGKDSAAPTVTTFGGDVVISGALHGGSPLQVGGYDSNLGSDVVFFVTGSSTAAKADPGSNALFGGGLVVSGGAYFNSTISDLTGQQNIDLSSTDYMAFNVGGTNTWLEIDATLGQPVISVNPYSENYDFLVGGDSPGFSSYQAIFVDADENAVILASKQTSTAFPGSDVNLFVSGTIGARGGAARAVSVFGGDLHVSGNLTVDGSSPGGGGGNTLDQAYDQGGAGAGAIITADSGPVQIQNPSSTGLAITGSTGVEPRIKLLDSGSPANLFSDIYVNNNGDLNITTGNGSGAKNHIILNPRSGGTGNVILGQAGADSTLTFQGSTAVTPSSPYIRANTSSPVEFRMHNAAQNGKVVIQASTYPLGSGPGPVVINEDGGACDFRVESDLRQGAILVDGGTEQVALLTDGTTAADAYGLNASTSPIPSDIALYVSGAAYDLSSAAFGAGNVGGKSATFGGDLVVSGAIIGGNSSLSGITGEASPLILTALNGSSIYHGAGSHGFYGDVSGLQNPGDDGFFFVSGSIGSRGTADRGTAILGGDAVVSGSLYVMTGSNQGIVLQSPLGNKFYLTVDDAGNLSTAAV